MRKILKMPNKILRLKSKRIRSVDAKTSAEFEEVAQVLAACENGAGLAAPQVGISKRFFGIKDPKSGKVALFVNPRIVKTYGKKVVAALEKEGGVEDFLEGCLSVPDVYGTVKRYLKIDVTWQNVVDGKLEDKKISLSGFGAIVFQHELDHLNGVLFIDHVKLEGGKLFWGKGERMEAIEGEEKKKLLDGMLV